MARVVIRFRMGSRATATELRIGNRTIAGGDISAYYCGVDRLAEDAWPHFGIADASYAVAESQALWVALLSELPCPRVNEPSPDSLAGYCPTSAELCGAAVRLGLRTATYDISLRQSLPSPTGYILVSGGRLRPEYGRGAALTKGEVAAFGRLSRGFGLGLAEYYFTEGSDGHCLTGMSRRPLMAAAEGGDRFFDLVVASMRATL